MKAKLNLDAGTLDLDGTPEELAAYVKAIVPIVPPTPFGTYFVNPAIFTPPACTCATTLPCAKHSFTTVYPDGQMMMIPAGAPNGFLSAEIGRAVHVPHEDLPTK